jgi:ATP:ADP antiporter, AAA family
MTTAQAPTEDAGPPPAKSWIEWLLSPIADVRPGEAVSALLMALTMFLLLGGYYLLKTAREAFILSEGGAEVKSYSSAGQALLLLIIVPLYGMIASRVNRTQLVQWVTLFFAANIGMFLLALDAGFHIGIPYFLWLGIFNVMVVAQFWGFAADLYTEEQGRRLFPLIGVGSSLGAWVGALRAGHLAAGWGPSRLLVGGAGDLIACVILARIVDVMARRAAPAQSARSSQKLAEGPSGFRMILSNRYLTLIAVLVVLLNIVTSSGEYLFGRYVVEAANATYGVTEATKAAREQFIATTYSSYFSSISLVGFLLQLFVVSKVFKYLGVGRSLFVHPIVAVVSYLMMLRAPSFEAVRLVKIADSSVSYSLGNTAIQALWLPTSRETKYKAKQAVDSFCVRAGDVLQAAVVYTGELTAMSVSGFAMMTVVFASIWIGVVSALQKRLRIQEQTIAKAERKAS